MHVSWGDVLEKFIKGNESSRSKYIAAVGLVPGSFVIMGSRERNHFMTVPPSWMHVWLSPDFAEPTFNVNVGSVAMIVAVDCESDPHNDWLMVFINSASSKVMGWVPRGHVRLVQ